MAPTMAEAGIIAELISGINKKLNRDTEDFFDLDEEPDLPSNRGNKLKRKSVFAHEGQMYGKKKYKKKVNHAGYDRFILSQRPKRYDIEGYPLDSEDEDFEADADAAERDPYHGIDVQGLLMPLTAAPELWRHPGMSHTYKSDILPDMARKANEMLRREKRTLYLVKELATRFRGDHASIPCKDLLTANDEAFFDVDPIVRSIRAQTIGLGPGKHTPEAAIEVNVIAVEDRMPNGIVSDGTQAEDLTVAEVEPAPSATADGVAQAVPSANLLSAPMETDTPRELDPVTLLQPTDIKQEANADGAATPEANRTKVDAAGSLPDDKDEAADAQSGSSPIPRMVTRGAAAAANGNGVSALQAGDDAANGARSASPPASLPPVHPLFIPPASSIPDRDLGLPPYEAEDIRKLLNVFVQKQEEVVRGCERMYEGFLKANRLRNTVYRWSRAEGHVGEMSDNEEWVDQEEWGLDEPLRKGAAEGEEEVTDDRRGKGRRRGAA